MKTVLIFGNNKITAFLHNALAARGIETIDITDGAPHTPTPDEQLYAVIDASNAEINDQSDVEFIHNTAGIKELIDISSKNSSSFIFLYREAGELRPENPLAAGLDLISTYGRQKDISFAKVQLEDIYGPDINTSRILGSFIESILEGDSLVVNNDDNEHYLLNQKDFVDGLTEIIELLHKNRVGRHFTLFPEDSITEIELAHFVNELTDLNLDIDYTSTDEYKHHDLMENETNYPGDWYPEVELQEGITELFEYYDIPIPENAEVEIRDENHALESEPLYDPMDKFDKAEDDRSERIESHPDPAFRDYDVYDEINHTPNKISDSDKPFVPKTTKSPVKQKSKNPAKRKKIVVAALALVLLAILSAPSFSFTYRFISAATSISRANENIKLNNFPRANIESAKALKKLTGLHNIPGPVSSVASIIGVNQDEQYKYLETYRELSEAIQLTTSNTYITGIDNRVLGTSTEDSFSLQGQIEKSLELIQSVENNLQNIDSKLKFLKGTITDGYDLVRNTQNTLEQAKTINPVIGDLIGKTSPKKYLLLIVDGQKIRPAGGIVKEMGLVEMSYGRPKILKSEDMTELNSQASLNIFPGQPEPIKTLTASDSYRFQDSAWDIDFPVNAKLIENYYKTIRGEDVDGVVVINSSTLSEISDVDEALTFSSLDQFLTSLENIPAMGLKTLDLLNKKDIIIYSNSDKVQTALLKNNWAGALTSEKFDDYLYVIDSRIDQEDNPASLSRETTYTGNHPDLNEGRYVRNLEIKYSAPSDLKETIVDHVRIVVPENTLLNYAKINNGGDDKNVSRIVELGSYGTFTIFSADIAITPGGTTILKLEYESPEKTFEDNNIELMVQKQPGISDETLNLIFKSAGKSTTTQTTLSKDTEFKFPL